MKIHLSILVSAGIVLALGACGSDASTADTTPAPATTVVTSAASTPPVDSSAPGTTAGGSAPVATTGGSGAGSEAPDNGAAQKDVKVSIGNFKFEPADVTVAAGGTITWTNDHNQPHTATASGAFDTGSLAPGESKTITFDTAGTFNYICSFHPFMTGTVVVV